MNDQMSAAGSYDDGHSGSYKRKKVRAKYAPKACVACRRSKLKCSGENPCRRCRDNDRRCFFSEDQTAAEVLQNLSRPTPSLVASSSNGHSNGAVRRVLFPRDDQTQRRSSEASISGVSIESRMARMEEMMEALIQKNGISIAPRTSIRASPSPLNEYQGNGDTYAAALVPVQPELGMPPEWSESNPCRSIFERAERERAVVNTIHLSNDNRAYPFFCPDGYNDYLDRYFKDINPDVPCIDVAPFRLLSQQMLSQSPIDSSSIPFLALHYLMFACVDVLSDENPCDGNAARAWDWYELADSLVGTKWLNEHGDVRLVQYFLIKATFLVYADRPNMAYTTVGIASRLAIQLGLHRKSRLGVTPRGEFYWDCLLRTLHITEYRISLSCGRPPIFRRSEWQLPEKPVAWKQGTYEVDAARTANLFLTHMTDWADCADAVWDILSGTEAPNDYVTVLKRISSWLQEDRGEDWSDPLSHTLSFVNDHFVNLQFLLWRRRKLFLHSTFDIDQIHARCALWAVEFVEHRMRVEICRASASRFYMASVLGSAVLVLSLYLLDTEKPAPDPPADFRRPYDSALKMLRELATSVPVARRILDDLQKPIDLVQNPPLEPLEEITASMPFNSPDFEEKASPSNLPEWESEFGGIDGIGRVDPSVGEGRQHGVLWV